MTIQGPTSDKRRAQAQAHDPGPGGWWDGVTVESMRGVAALVADTAPWAQMNEWRQSVMIAQSAPVVDQAEPTVTVVLPAMLDAGGFARQIDRWAARHFVAAAVRVSDAAGVPAGDVWVRSLLRVAAGFVASIENRWPHPPDAATVVEVALDAAGAADDYGDDDEINA